MISPGLLIAGIFLIGFILTFAGAGVVFTVLGLVALFGLVALGALSTSPIIGIHKKSFEKGFKIFVVLGFTFCGLPVGGPGLWLINKFSLWWTSQTALIAGTMCGLLGGFGLGLLAFHILRRLMAYFKKRLDLNI